MRRKSLGHFARAEQITLHGEPPLLEIGLTPRVALGQHAGIVVEDIDCFVLEFTGESINGGMIGDIELVDRDPAICVFGKLVELFGLVGIAAAGQNAPTGCIELAHPFETEPTIGAGDKASNPLLLPVR